MRELQVDVRRPPAHDHLDDALAQHFDYGLARVLGSPCLEGTKADLDISLFFERAGTIKSLRKGVIYLHKTINGDPDFLTFGTRLVDVSATYESGQPRPPMSESRGSKRKR